MGTLRDEIEKLPGDRVSYMGGLVSKADVLSILDEWELVMDKIVGGVDTYHGQVWFGNEYGGTKVEREICDKVNPGDHITIYVRRGKKDE